MKRSSGYGNLSRNIFHPQLELELRRVPRRRSGASVGGGPQRQRQHPRDKVSLINDITTSVDRCLVKVNMSSRCGRVDKSVCF